VNCDSQCSELEIRVLHAHTEEMKTATARQQRSEVDSSIHGALVSHRDPHATDPHSNRSTYQSLTFGPHTFMPRVSEADNLVGRPSPCRQPPGHAVLAPHQHQHQYPKGKLLSSQTRTIPPSEEKDRTSTPPPIEARRTLPRPSRIPAGDPCPHPR
jgi:hypothetical protein